MEEAGRTNNTRCFDVEVFDDDQVRVLLLCLLQCCCTRIIVVHTWSYVTPVREKAGELCNLGRLLVLCCIASRCLALPCLASMYEKASMVYVQVLTAVLRVMLLHARTRFTYTVVRRAAVY